MKVLESGAQSHLIYDFYVKTTVVNTPQAYDSFQIYFPSPSDAQFQRGILRSTGEEGEKRI
jgi:hypothetical protein